MQDRDIPDVDELIAKSGCKNEYYKLEECLIQFDRDWAKCQNFVKSWKQCHVNAGKRK